MIAYKNSAELTEKDITSSSDASCESHTAHSSSAISPQAIEPVLVRVQTHCLTGGVFGSSCSANCAATVDASPRCYRRRRPRSADLSALSNQPRLPVSSNTATQPHDSALPPQREQCRASKGFRAARLGSASCARSYLIGQILSDLGITGKNPPAHQPACARPSIARLRHRDRRARPHRSRANALALATTRLYRAEGCVPLCCSPFTPYQLRERHIRHLSLTSRLRPYLTTNAPVPIRNDLIRTSTYRYPKVMSALHPA